MYTRPWECTALGFHYGYFLGQIRAQRAARIDMVYISTCNLLLLFALTRANICSSRSKQTDQTWGGGGGGGWGRFPNFCTQAQTLIKKYTLDTIQKYNSKPESNLKLLPFLSQTGQCHLKCTPYSHLAGLSITLYHSVFFNRDIYVSFAFEFQKLYLHLHLCLHFVFGNAILF